MKRLIVSFTYDEDQIDYDDIRDNIVEFITATSAYVKAVFHEEEF